MDDLEDTKQRILSAYDYLKKCDLYRRTPISEMTEKFRLLHGTKHRFFVKNETLQEAGSFKIRGLLIQTKKLIEATENGEKKPNLVTYSAGNYGRAFANMCQKYEFDGAVVMPDFAPMERTKYIENMGLKTLRCATDQIQANLSLLIQNEERLCLHPFDDWDLIFGHASFGLEMLEDVEDIDVVIVCCGGGGILAGVALAMRLFGKPGCKVIGVEPLTANTMEQSFAAGHPVTKMDAASVASGLSPPCAGKLTYEVCRSLVDAVVTVTDPQILDAMRMLHQWGILAEPSGSAAMAAVIFDKIDHLRLHDEEHSASLNVVIAVTGGNCSDSDLKFVSDHQTFNC